MHTVSSAVLYTSRSDHGVHMDYFLCSTGKLTKFRTISSAEKKLALLHTVITKPMEPNNSPSICFVLATTELFSGSWHHYILTNSAVICHFLHTVLKMRGTTVFVKSSCNAHSFTMNSTAMT